MLSTASVTVTVSIGGRPKTFTAAGETDGDVHRLAKNLVFSTSGDSTNWLDDMGDEALRQKLQAKRLGLPVS